MDTTKQNPYTGKVSPNMNVFSHLVDEVQKADKRIQDAKHPEEALDLHRYDAVLLFTMARCGDRLPYQETPPVHIAGAIIGKDNILKSGLTNQLVESDEMFELFSSVVKKATEVRKKKLASDSAMLDKMAAAASLLGLTVEEVERLMSVMKDEDEDEDEEPCDCPDCTRERELKEKKAAYSKSPLAEALKSYAESEKLRQDIIKRRFGKM